MRQEPFHISADPSRGLVTITFDSVFWQPDVAVRFKADCLAAVTSLHCAPGQHLILVDLRNAVLQSQEVYEKMQALVGSSTAARIALVASAPLARMQTKRLQIRDNVVMFGDMEEAREWLLGDVRQVA